MNGCSRVDDEEDIVGSRVDDKEDIVGSRVDDEEDIVGSRVDDEEDIVGSRVDDKEDIVGSRVDDKEDIIVTSNMVVNRIVTVNFIRFIRIVMYNCISMGAKYFIFQYGNSFWNNVVQHQAIIY